MDHIDPIQAKNIQPPITSEIAAHAKKKLKESKMDTLEEALETQDSFILSDDSKGLPEKKKEAFLADAKEEISNMDLNSETFVDDATQKLVNSALKREYGSKLTGNSDYEQMEEIITRKLLRDPRYRDIIENFLGRLLDSE